MEMCLEDLMGLTVTSMSKRVQALQETAAAVHIIIPTNMAVLILICCMIFEKFVTVAKRGATRLKTAIRITNTSPIPPS